MKWSRYNSLFFSKRLNAYLLYNSASELLTEVDKKTYDILNPLKDKACLFNEDLAGISEELQDLLIKNLVITANDNDIINKYKLGVYQRRYDKNSVLSLTIAPTRDCNFRCVYCYEEERPPVYMNAKVQDALIEFVRKKKTKKVSVCWYGGEPTLSKDIIINLTNRIINEVGENNYNASIVTNGFLLDERFISLLKSLKIVSAQVTLDGAKETHDKRRPHKCGNSSYDMILSNLKKLSEVYPTFPVIVRVNVDKDNVDEFTKVYYTIRKINPIYSIYIGFVKDHSCSRDCISYNPEKIDIYQNLYYNKNIFLSNYLTSKKGEDCMARRINSYLIDPNGNLLKCWMDMGSEDNIIGNILNKEYHSNVTTLARYMKMADHLDSPKCNNCKAFLICNGGCPKERIQNLLDPNKKNDTCSIYKNSMHEMIEIIYSAIKQRSASTF